jgi:hypothetical protein
MKRFALSFLLLGWFVPFAHAQDGEHVQLGVFADYMNVPQTSNNFTGIGGRASFQPTSK